MTTGKNEHNIPVRSLGSEPEKPAGDAGLKTILDNLDAMVYVADFKTHELLYMNAFGYNILGDFQQGQKCWQVLQDADSPCSFCTNHLLLDSSGNATGVHV